MNSRSSTIRLPVSGSAASVIETDIVDAWGGYDEEHEEPYETVIRLAWNGKSLAFTKEAADQVRRALNDMSNRCDELSREPGVSAEERAVYRNASGAFSTLMQKAGRAG